MATAPASALMGFAGMQMPPQREAVTMAAIMPDVAPILAPGAPGEIQRPAELPPAAVEASYYGEGFAGRPTANGETFDPNELTAAHRTLPFGTEVKVVDAATGQSVVVRINDRGPFHGNREIDLSEAAARKLGMIASGTAKVNLDVVARA
jgi:rare lipoprotein A